ncbi:sigma-70 family RNA polymerase sigma factor [Ferviditalea candida]|uniref:Sigma-70 family RNA polymerase sigma factor n=1 Tax=Ferviditalea candida TaxID=3108399 RepID=A0ABU5ZGH6_9BACL|nr:sigma-70 family RNA polymerase sigma factor [Paenibacillaceae bacterium T2]
MQHIPFPFQNEHREWEPHFCAFQAANERILRDPIIRRFLEDPEHVRLLCLYLFQSEPFHRQKLEEAFRRFYFEIRFVRYLTLMMRYRALDFHRIRTRWTSRMPLIYDRPPADRNSESWGEYLASKYAAQNEPTDPQTCNSPADFIQSLNNESLLSAFGRLTERQQLVTTLSFAAQLSDGEISRILGISQQAVNKTKIRSIHKMRREIQGKKQKNEKLS